MNRPEQNLQKAAVNWFRYSYPKTIIIHVANGGKRTAAEARIFKSIGVLSGFPDLLICKPSKDYGALMIELKAGKGKETDNQLRVHEVLRNSGYRVEVCNSFDSFRKIVEEYMLT